MIETHLFDVVNGATLTIDSSNMKGQRFSDGNRNIQVSCSNLGGGTFSLFYRFPEANNFVSHVTGATETDSIMIAGLEAPVCDAIQIQFTNVPAGTTKVVVNTWPRGL